MIRMEFDRKQAAQRQSYQRQAYEDDYDGE